MERDSHCTKKDLQTIPDDFRLSAYTYELPEDQVAQHPSDKRGSSRLFVIDKESGENHAAMFSDLGKYLPKNALLVINNSKVLPARLFGNRPSGGKVEFLMLTPLPLVKPVEQGEWKSATVEGLMRMSKRVKVGTKAEFGDDLWVEVTETAEFGRCEATINWRGELKDHFLQQGHLPLPPYIKREDTTADKDRYQTVYADDSQLGSVAAPTAGLHFTEEMRDQLSQNGIEWAEVTLYVGYGTFSPVRCDDIREHAMHKEFLELSEETAQKIAKAKAEGRPVIAVGTTSSRVLEGAFREVGSIAPFKGWTNIFIYPGYKFNVVDHMITNFHLPESTLLMMISAFASKQRILDGYDDAISQGFRVFSYGDSMLIL